MKNNSCKLCYAKHWLTLLGVHAPFSFVLLSLAKEVFQVLKNKMPVSQVNLGWMSNNFFFKTAFHTDPEHGLISF